MTKYFTRTTTAVYSGSGNYLDFKKLKEVKKIKNEKDLKKLNNNLKIKFKEITRLEYDQLKKEWLIYNFFKNYKNNNQICQEEMKIWKQTDQFEIWEK